jgi:hypothetical protein
MQEERLRDDARQLLRAAYEKQAARGDVGVGVDLREGAEELGLNVGSPHLVALADFMVVTGWIEPDMAARAGLDDPNFLITERGMEVLREDMG